MKYCNKIVIKFCDYIKLPYNSSIDEYKELFDWQDIKSKHPYLTLRTLFNPKYIEKIENIIKIAKKNDKKYNPPKFSAFYYIEFPPSPSPRISPNDLKNRIIKNWCGIEHIYIPSLSKKPPSFHNDICLNSKIKDQSYLFCPPKGINALDFLENRNSISTIENQTLVDMEDSWYFSHEDLPINNIESIFGMHDEETEEFKEHGLNVLGIIASINNNKGCIGIASGLKAIKCISPLVDCNYGYGYLDHNIPNALMYFLQLFDNSLGIVNDYYNTYDYVLLIEQQIYLEGSTLPVEADFATFCLIELATKMNLVVIEAAGNGGCNLNEKTIIFNNCDDNNKKTEKYIFNKNSQSFQDSGAIMVGASSYNESKKYHKKATCSNYGNRIDCFSWGNSVTTLSKENGGYKDNFGGTSSASAIIAGVALFIQGMAIFKFQKRFSPSQLRKIFQDEEIGTKTYLDEDNIGVMPDMKAIYKKYISGNYFNLQY